MIEIHETFDAKLLADLNEEIQTFHHLAYPEIFKPYNRETIRGFFKSALEHENAHVFVARQAEVVLGYVLIFMVDFKENPFQYSRRYILLDQVAVIEKYRGRGVGSTLLNKVFEFAKSISINEIELNHWTSNGSARKFFKKNGFEYFNEKMRLKLD
jgi:GNAT superfamily N-acetyltransferase